jgi:predicted dehydrogenase
VVDPRAGGGQARALREAAEPPPEEVDRAFDVAEREGRVLAEAFMWRHHPQVARARELLDAARSATCASSARTSRSPPDRDDIRLQAALDGGGLMDVGCYCVSGCRAMAGAEPERGYASYVAGGHGRRRRARRHAALPRRRARALRLRAAYPAATSSRRSAPGLAVLDDPWHGRDAVIESAAATARRARRDRPANSYALELADFEAAVRGEREPLLGRDDALGQARTIAALYTSAERNAPCPIG